MIITVRNHELECDEIYTKIVQIADYPSKFKLYKEGGFAKTFDKDIYSLIREEP